MSGHHHAQVAHTSQMLLTTATSLQPHLSSHHFPSAYPPSSVGGAPPPQHADHLLLDQATNNLLFAPADPAHWLQHAPAGGALALNPFHVEEFYALQQPKAEVQQAQTPPPQPLQLAAFSGVMLPEGGADASGSGNVQACGSAGHQHVPGSGRKRQTRGEGKSKRLGLNSCQIRLARKTEPMSKFEK